MLRALPGADVPQDKTPAWLRAGPWAARGAGQLLEVLGRGRACCVQGAVVLASLNQLCWPQPSSGAVSTSTLPSSLSPPTPQLTAKARIVLGNQTPGAGPLGSPVQEPGALQQCPRGRGAAGRARGPAGCLPKPAWELLIQGRNEAGAELSIWAAD